MATHINKETGELVNQTGQSTLITEPHNYEIVLVETVEEEPQKLAYSLGDFVEKFDEVMSKSKLEEKMAEHAKYLNAIFDKIVEDVNEFKKGNEKATIADLKGVKNFVDGYIQEIGWIEDRINNTLKTEVPKKSLVVKLRKVLGYAKP